MEPNPGRDDMGTERPDKRQIFNTAAEIADPAERGAYLEQACEGDARLRAEMEDLLRHDAEAGGFLEQPVAGDRPTDVLDAVTEPEGPPDAVDPSPDEIPLDFLQPCDVPGRLGNLGHYEVIDVIGRECDRC
jgi:hypothetical protein